MDEVDQKIIEELSHDARKPFIKMAKKIGVSSQTIKRKFEEMKKNGIIRLCTISVDLKRLGYIGSAHLLLTAEANGSPEKIIEVLRKTPNIVAATRAIGEYEAYAVLLFKDYQDFYNQITQIKAIIDISNIDICLAMPGLQYFPPNKAFNRLEG
jgi:DNA-binding Lrp family transcriptional regulator